MLALSSTGEVIARLASAKEVAVEAYTLRRPMLEALEAAARRGAHVTVRLEARPYHDAGRHLGRMNAHAVRALKAAGVDAHVADPIHAKVIRLDGSLYVDEKNWNATDIVLRDDDAAEAASIPMDKSGALAAEANLLADARASDGVIVESESFGAGNVAYDSLKALALAGAKPRLLVSRDDLRGSGRERAVLDGLVRHGVRVRVCPDSAKLAVAGDRAWLGSANATYTGKGWQMPDWGLCTRKREIVDCVRARLEAEWNSARELRVRRA